MCVLRSAQADINSQSLVYVQVERCVSFPGAFRQDSVPQPQPMLKPPYRVQVNIPAESGEMGILAQHVPSIEQLKPGLVEVIEEAGGSKQFFCTDKSFWKEWAITDSPFSVRWICSSATGIQVKHQRCGGILIGQLQC